MNMRFTQRGFTLVELMVSITIAVFLIAGLVTLVGAMKRTSTTQSALSRLQDNERLAMSLITDVIQSAGYFPNPVVNTSLTSLPAAGVFTQAAQSVFGTGAGTAAATGDTITVRYLTAGTATPGSDGLINCGGSTNGTAATFVNEFNVAVVNNISYLQCKLTVNGGPLQTINPSAGTFSIDAYLDAPAVTAGSYWPNVISVKVILYFQNPLFGQPGQTSQTISFMSVIGVMNKSGVTT
jgi:type IV pilus assembly protein PilW